MKKQFIMSNERPLRNTKEIKDAIKKITDPKKEKNFLQTIKNLSKE